MLGLLAALVLLTATTLAPVNVTVEKWIRDDAEIAAAGWKHRITLNVPDIAAGAEPSAQSATFPSVLCHNIRIVRHEICDLTGHVELVSDQTGARRRAGDGAVDPHRRRDAERRHRRVRPDRAHQRQRFLVIQDEIEHSAEALRFAGRIKDAHCLPVRGRHGGADPLPSRA